MYVRVVSMPCCELFDMKSIEYQMEILSEGTVPYLLSLNLFSLHDMILIDLINRLKLIISSYFVFYLLLFSSLFPSFL